ncbi:MAG: ribosome-associated translation inhibitor RaiA [Sandaracinaceae bacterium]
MEIQHTCKDFDLTDSIRIYSEEKMKKACAMLDGLQGIRMHVTYETIGHANHGDNQGVNVVLFVPNSEPLKAMEATNDLYATIDLASKDIERQVKKYRDRLTTHR